MKKILMAIMFVLVVCVVCISAPFALKSNAATVDDLTFELNYDGASYTLTKCSTTASGNLNIPDSYNGLPITVIGETAFYNCNSLTSITIPDSVTSIGSSAFSRCSGLTDIIIPDSVTSIGSSAFYNTAYYNNSSNWENNILYIGNHLIKAETTLSGNFVVKNGTVTISPQAFYNCSDLKAIKIPESVVSIGKLAFSGCENLTLVAITDLTAWCNIDFGGSNANPLYYADLYLNGKLVTDLVIPEDVETIKKYTFYSYDSLTSVTIEDGVTSIGDYAFSNCSGLTSVTIGDSVATSIGRSAFSGCTTLTSVTIGDSVTSIGLDAFSNCSGFTTVTIGDSVTCICDYAFSNCSGLTSITIPDNVASIGKSAFSGCTTLTSVTIGDSVASIGQSAFSGCTTLTSVTIGDSVTSIGSSAFRNCSGLTSITIPDSVASIGQSAFYSCTTLASVTIGDSVTSIGSSAFEKCTSLTSINITNIASWCNIDFESSADNPLYYVKNLYLNGNLVTDLVIPEGVESIKDYAFSGCTALTSVTIGNSASIGDYAFCGCSSLKSVTIGDSVTSIGSYVFNKCDSLTSVTIGDSVTSIGDDAFSYCTALKSVTIGDSVTSIGDDAFYRCSNLNAVYISDVASWCNIDFYGPSSNLLYGSASNPLYYAENLYLNGELVTELTIPESITEIKKYAFSYCTALTSVTIGDSVTSIGYGAFEGCKSLTSVTIPDSVTSIGSAAFRNCTSLTSVTIGKNVKSICSEAFYKCSALKYVFYTGSSSYWNRISIDAYNSSLTSAKIHYNATDHSHSVVKSLPFFEGMEGSIEDACPVCGFINSSNKLLWLNDYVTAVDTKNAVVDTTSNTLLLDISACQDVTEAIVEMDGYTLTTIPNSSYGFIGTGSKLKVSTTSGTQVAEYTLVIRGDVNGDSVCDALDLMLIELARTNNTTLTGVYFTAANLSEDGTIDISDFNAAVNRAVV